MRSGFPRPVAGAELVLGFAAAGHAAMPSLRVQRAIARAVLASPGRCGRTFSSTSGMSPPRPRPCSTRSPTRGPTRVGGDRCTSTSGRRAGGARHGGDHHFKGRLPYHLHTRSMIVEIERPGAWWPRSTVTCAAAGPGRSRPSRGHACALRLASARRSRAAARVDARAASGVPVEPQLGDRPGHRGARTVRPVGAPALRCPRGCRLTHVEVYRQCRA